MTSSLVKDQVAIRLQMKQAARVALELRTQAQTTLNNINALGISYGDPEEAEEANGLFALSELLAALSTHATNLTKAADIGNNLG